MTDFLTPEILTVLFIALTILGILTGYQLAPVVGAVGLLLGYLVLGPPVVKLMYHQVYGLLLNYPILALPLFVFMGSMLARTGITDRLYEALHLILGRFRGGLAVSTVLIGTVLAACLGVITASVSMLTIVSLKAMVNRGYDKSLASGSICAGGTLGILIPPSVMLVLWGPMAGLSVGKLFMAAFGPGFLLSFLYVAYISIRAFLQPKIAPTAPEEELRKPLKVKLWKLITALVPVAALVLAVLGSIFFGVAPPTEAAGLGALAAILLTVAYREFTWQKLKESLIETVRITSFSMFIGAFAVAAVGVFMVMGGGQVTEKFILNAPFGMWGGFVIIMIVAFVLGTFMDIIGIVFLMVPIVSPIVPLMGFDPIWFAIMMNVNLQMSFMTPPMALAIFILKGVADPELGVTTWDIIKGIVPFVGLVILALGILAIFPQIIMWLPSTMRQGW